MLLLVNANAETVLNSNKQIPHTTELRNRIILLHKDSVKVKRKAAYQKNKDLSFLRRAFCCLRFTMSCGVSWNLLRLHSGITPACITAFLNLLTTESAGSSSPTKTCATKTKITALNHMDSKYHYTLLPQLTYLQSTHTTHKTSKFTHQPKSQTTQSQPE